LSHVLSTLIRSTRGRPGFLAL